MKTTINDRGEEVTEEVWEDSQQASPEPDQASPAASAQPHPQRAASEPPQASPAASPEKSQQDDALKEQPGQFAHHNITAACKGVGASLGHFTPVKVLSTFSTLRSISTYTFGYS